MWRRHVLLLLVATMLVFLNMGRPARAQDEADAEDEQPVQQPRGLFASDAQFEQWFDQMVFGQTGGIDQTRKQFASRLSAKIGELDEMYRFTPDQKKKLELAGTARHLSVLREDS